MLSHAKEHESLAGKLLLSTALVAVTAVYGWWQAGVASQQQAAAMAAMQAAMLAASGPAPASQPQAPGQMMATAPEMAATPGSPSGSVVNAAPAPDASVPAAAATPAAASSTPGNTKLAMAAPSANAPAQNALQPATPAPAANGGLLPADPPPAMLTGMAAIQNFIPTAGVSPPLPPVSGVPDPDAKPAIPAGGTRLEDGDYTSDRVQFEWGDLRVRIVVTGGKITTVQIMSYPDHRSQSLYLIQLADPFLTREVIKTQQSNVHTVSTATNTSLAFREAVAGAIVKATR